MNLHNIFFEGEKLAIWELFLRSSILYFMLFCSTKVMGFRQPGIMTPYNFLMAAGISHIAASRMVNPKARPIDAIVIIILYTLLNLLISYLYFKIPTIVSQKPVILIKNGKVVKENLSKTKLNIDNLFSILRQKNAHNLQKVDYLIAESTGDFSVGINGSSLPITKQDMTLAVSQDTLSQIIIYKGNIDDKILKNNQLDTIWLNNELKLNNIQNINTVYLGILTPDKKLYVNA